MSDPSTHSPARSSVLSLIGAGLNADVLKLIPLLLDVGQRFMTLGRRTGIYEVLECDVRLELKDRQGKRAVYFKRQKVRFLQDNVIAYEDKAWGDGEIFADYKCSPGIAVDRYRDGHRYRILISLREAKKRGDIQEFHIQRTITDGFTKEREDFQTDIDHKTHKLSLSVVFPPGKIPKQVSLIEQNILRTTPLRGDQLCMLPDGRWQVRWKTEHPRLFESYIIRWEW